MFPGQGSQRPGMGQAWRDHPAWALVEELSSATGRDLAELLLKAGPDELRLTRNAQLATYALSLVILASVRRGPLGAGAGLPESALVSAVAGHSLGEYTALVASGAIGPIEGARLVQARGEAMQAASSHQPGTMAAVIGLGLDDTLAACNEVSGAWVANDNAPGQVVIAGTPDGVGQAARSATRRGAKRAIPLQVGGAFHSPLMSPAQDRLDQAIGEADLGHSTVPLVANVDATPHTSGFASLLSAQLCSRVRWRESLTALSALGGRLFVELGPGTELCGMVRRTLPDAVRANVGTPDDLEILAGVLEALPQAP